MRSVGVVVDPPVFDDLPGFVEVGEQVFVEALVAQATVEALDKAILHRFARCDVVPVDAKLFLPGQYSVRRKLGAVVAHDHPGATSALDDLIELAQHPPGGQRCVDDQAEAFPGEVVDQGQDTEAPTAGKRVHHEVERPAQVLILRDCHWRPRAERPFTTAAFAH